MIFVSSLYEGLFKSIKKLLLKILLII